MVDLSLLLVCEIFPPTQSIYYISLSLGTSYVCASWPHPSVENPPHWSLFLKTFCVDAQLKTNFPL